MLANIKAEHFLWRRLFFSGGAEGKGNAFSIPCSNMIHNMIWSATKQNLALTSHEIST